MPLFPRPSLQPPEAIKPSAYFTSDTFIRSATSDVQDLLTAYETAQLTVARDLVAAGGAGKGKERAVDADGGGKDGGEEDGNGRLPSPFKTFKEVYAQKGWTLVHLAVVDPALRKEWFDTLTRLILGALRRRFIRFPAAD